jgi:hypothetical protein
MEWRKLTEEEKEEITKHNTEKAREYLSQFPRRSYDLEDLVSYIMKGGKVFRLDTGNRGNDDLLVGETEEEVLADYFGWLDDPEAEAEGIEVTEISLENSFSDMGLMDWLDYLKAEAEAEADED